MNQELLDKLLTSFKSQFGDRDGVRLAFAPGRVNLIGEHTDYNGGFVMPMGLDRRLYVLFRPASGSKCRFWSENYEEWDEFSLDDLQKSEAKSWVNYIRGAAWALQDEGYDLSPIEGLVYGDVPIGAGLSSSAAMEVSNALAFCSAVNADINCKNLALLCQRAENKFVGVNCGIMDQFVSVHAAEDYAVMLDCRSLEHEMVPLDTSEVKVVVCNTMVDHELGSSAYNQRRAKCEEAARILNEKVGNVEQLRDVTSEMLEANADALDDVTYRRARHVVSEDERVQKALKSLNAGDYAEFGRLMNASHDSLKDDYEVTCDELDLMVDLARKQKGCLGARMTGAGFGGCTVNLIEADAADDFMAAMAAGYEEKTEIDPDIFEFNAAEGASIQDV